jgi:hypothetical protein
MALARVDGLALHTLLPSVQADVKKSAELQHQSAPAQQ